MEKHLVIIGGVAAGTKAAAKARREDPKLKISIYTDDEHISYSACGLPYYIENLFTDYNKLIVRTTEEFKTKENIDIYTSHRVTKIAPENNEIIVKKNIENDEFKVSYSQLLIATGARPFIPPIKGIESNNVYPLRNVQDGINIKNKMQNSQNAVIIGGGYIGLEVFEAFIKNGIQTTLIEMSEHIMPLLDKDMAELLQDYIVNEVGEKSKTKLILNDAVNKVVSDKDNNVTSVETLKGKIIETDIVVIATGVRPNIELATNAGIELGTTGAIKVNSKMQTNIKNIYAAGDCAEQTNIITEEPTWVPLGSTANKQGRVAAINITGGNAEFKGVLGSAITRFHDYTVAMTGLSEKQAQKANIEYEYAIVHSKDIAGYMPDSKVICIKLLAEKATRKLIGAQVLGKGDVDKRINVIATALNADMTVEELLDTDLAYAPPYSTALDPVLKTAQVLENKLHKRLESISCKELQKYIDAKKDVFVIEHDKFSKMVQKNPDLINNYKNKEIVLYCRGGMHSYILGRKLKKNGYSKIKFVDGGIKKD